MTTSKRLALGIAGLSAVACAGTLLLGTGTATAATATGYEPDGQAPGAITFYDSTGAVVTSGSTTSALPAYAVGSISPRGTDRKASLRFAKPDPNQPTYNWYVDAVGVYNTYPLTGSSDPAAIKGLDASHPVVPSDPNNDETLDQFLQNVQPLSTASGYANLVQVRMVTSNAASQPTQTWDTADLLIDPTAKTWTQVFPTQSTTTLTASAACPGQPVSLTAQVTPGVAGSVQFEEITGGTTTVLSSGAVDTTTGRITYPASLPSGTHNLEAVFTPTWQSAAGSTDYGTSFDTTNVTVSSAACTTTALAVDKSSATQGDSVTVTATVKDTGNNPVTAGTVSFYDNGSGTPLNGTPVDGSVANDGTYAFTTSSLGVGSHSIVAKFTPADPTAFQASASPAVQVSVSSGACAQTGSSCTDKQNVQAEVPTGTLSITTPYTSANPLDVGSLTYDSTNNQFAGHAAFSDIVVTDHRSGGANSYTVSAQSTDLTNGSGSINSQNVGLTGLTSTPGTGFAGVVTPIDNAAANPAVAPGATGSQGLGGSAPHAVFTATNALGTVTVNGTMTVTAPSSTKQGTYAGTVTFTVG